MTGLRNASLFTLLCSTLLLGTACSGTPAHGGGKDGGTTDGGTTAPTVTITAPSNNATFAAGSSITFTGKATSSTGKAITGNALAWTSNKDGQLGLGATVTTALTTVGTQTITLTATDAAGHSGSASIKLTITAANVPVVTITSPQSGHQAAIGEPIQFTATVTPPSGATVSNANIVWKSSLDGQIGIGASIRTGLATAGTHTITCTATDSNGKSGSASVTVDIVNHVAPKVVINTPADGSYFLPSSTITFDGTATAAAGSTITAGTLKWTDQNGQIGLGATVKTALPVGDHTVTFSATDNTGAVGSATITIHVVTNIPPACVINRPNDGSSFLVGQTISFSGGCTDPDSNQAPTNLTWKTDVDGQIGLGATVQTALGSAGDRVVTLCAKDPVDPTLIGCSAPITIHVVANTAPTCAITAPTANAIVQVGDQVQLSGTVTDAQDPSVTGVNPTAAWTDDLNNNLGARAQTRTVFTNAQVGTRTLTLTGTDSGGMTCTATVTITVNQPPVANITSVTQGGSSTQPFSTGTQVDFVGNGSDPDGDSVTLTWADSFSGILGTGTSASLISPTMGHHTIYLTASDGNGGVGIAAQTFTVMPATGNLVQPYTVANQALPNNANVTCVASDSSGKLSFSPRSTQVWWMDGTSTTSTAAPTFTNALDRINTITIDEANASAYVGTQGHGYWVCPYSSSTGFGNCTGPYQGRDLPSDNVNAIVPVTTANGQVLVVGTSGGLFIPDTFSGSNTGTRYLTGRDIRGLAADASTVWVATNGRGLYHFDPASGTTLGNWRQADGAPSDNLFSVAVGYQGGAIWVGSDSGLGRYEPGAQTWATWQQGGAPYPGLLGNRINALAIDRPTIPTNGGQARDVIWIGTTAGVTRFDPTIPSVMNLTTADGLPSNQINGITILPSGTKVFATSQGLARYTGQ